MKTLPNLLLLFVVLSFNLTGAQDKATTYRLLETPIIAEEAGIASFFPKVVFHQNMYYMIYSKGSNHKDFATYLALSDNGYQWKKNLDPILTIEKAINQKGQCILWSIPVIIDNEWQLYYIVKDTLDNPLAIERASAKSINGSWKIEPVMGLEDNSNGTDWDSGQLHPNDIVYHEGKYYLYYEAYDSSSPSIFNRSSSIGMATSSDGLIWNKHNLPETNGEFEFSDPVLEPGGNNTWDEATSVTADVRIVGGKWEMVYSGTDLNRHRVIGHALSENGIDWVKTEKPILNLADSRNLYFPQLITNDEKELMYVFVNDPDRKTSNIHLVETNRE